ncbi:hypothetical protein [Nocardia tengchongensis]|uniref:hypothetical protein n=1 Tax=Nocardia tengchongensis TaxID=2055889 RepID=UPI00368199DC
MKIRSLIISALFTLGAVATVAGAGPATAKDTDVDMKDQCQVQYPATADHKAGTEYLMDKNNAYTWRCTRAPIGSAKEIRDLPVDVQAFCARKGRGNAMARDIHNAYSWKCATTPTPGTGDTWTDCSGNTICTKYWSRAKTVDIDRELTAAKAADGVSWAAAGVCALVTALATGGVADPASVVFGGMAGAACQQGVSSLTASQLNGMDTAAAAAVPANGCLQVAYPKSGGDGPRTWRYTTDSGYCWDR